MFRELLQRLKSRFLAKLTGHYSLRSLDSRTQTQLFTLQNRFQSAMRFLNNTAVSRYGLSIRLNRLPWYLFIGLPNAGKTTLLTNSGVNFVLHKRAIKSDTKTNTTSEHCDWWATRELCIVDVPSQYLSNKAPYPHVWDFLLHLIKEQRGTHGINGIIIALPLPELIKNEPREIWQRLQELQDFFPDPVPYQILITKCDLLPGFIEFFGDAPDEEIDQAWGISLPPLEVEEKLDVVFTKRFNLLIKKLNQLLLWRLHHERNGMSKPYIKDFPLQIEHLKKNILEFAKQLATTQRHLYLQGVYLTSARQESVKAANAPAAETMEIKLFQETPIPSRAYFIKKFFTRVLTPATKPSMTIKIPFRFAYAVYVAGFAIVVAAAFMISQDYQSSVEQATVLQTNFSNYKLAIRGIEDPDALLIQTLSLLDSLQKETENTGYKRLLAFYSGKSVQKANEVYQQALRNTLLPEIRDYLGNYLHNPVNKSLDSLYAALRAYLMLGDSQHFQAGYVLNTMLEILPKTMSPTTGANILAHGIRAFSKPWAALSLDNDLIQDTRKFLVAQPGPRLAYIILKNMNDNNAETDISLLSNTSKPPVFTSPQATNQIPTMFTAKVFAAIFNQEINIAAQEALFGNWVLGQNNALTQTPNAVSQVAQQLHSLYINNYVDVWESLLANIHISTPQDLAQADSMVINLVSNKSPLLKLLRSLHENTYFEPILSASPKLQLLDLLAEKNPQSQALLFQIFAGLQNLHQYLLGAINATDHGKAAFTLLSNHMLHRSDPDAIMQLRLVANKCPEPVKNWLDKLANDTWHFLIRDASHYLDTAWQNQVIRVYQTDIANHYPFAARAEQEVELSKFINFFGKSGVAMSFYTSYLQPFVDTSTPEWHWKKMADGEQLPFSDSTLHQIQQLVRINQIFFPNNDDKIYVQFALQPYQFGKLIKSVRLNINDKHFIDDRDGAKNPHVIGWPSDFQVKMTSVRLFMNNERVIGRNFPGEWGWFKLVNQSFESLMNKKEILLNLSLNEHEAKYLLFTDGQNPFISLNLEHFQLPSQLFQQENLHVKSQKS